MAEELSKKILALLDREDAEIKDEVTGMGYAFLQVLTNACDAYDYSDEVCANTMDYFDRLRNELYRQLEANKSLLPQNRDTQDGIEIN